MLVPIMMLVLLLMLVVLTMRVTRKPQHHADVALLLMGIASY